MKNKLFTFSALVAAILLLASCGSSRSGYYNGGHRKGYGCPATSQVKPLSAASTVEG